MSTDVTPRRGGRGEGGMTPVTAPGVRGSGLIGLIAFRCEIHAFNDGAEFGGYGLLRLAGI